MYHTLYKINLKFISDLHVELNKRLEGNVENICNLRFGKEVLDMTSKA